MEVDSVRLKTMLIDMMRWFHEFCEENNLTYYVVGGTMLGAMRHEGFIPWDDDIDVAMPREDYSKLERLMGNLGGRYVLETPNSEHADFFYPSSKLYDAETTLVENTRYKIKRGIYLDVFPLDGAGNTKEEGIAYYQKVKFRKNLLLTLTTGIRKGRNLYKNLAVYIMHMLPNWVLNKKKILRSLDALCAQRNFEQYEFGGNLVGNWMEREVMPRGYFGKPQLYKFESIWVYGVEKADEYLTALYGDWQKLPPIEKQKSHHDFLYIDLEKTFIG